MTTPQPLLSVIVVTYNSAALLASCVEPLRPLIASGLAELIVVDNDSKDNPEDALVHLGIEHSFVATGHNGGFAYAVNVGAKQARGEFIMLLNPDVTATSEMMAALLERIRSDESLAAVAPLLVTDGVATANGGRLPTTRAIFAHTSGLARALRRHRPSIGHYAYVGPNQGDIDLEWLSGGLLLIRRTAAPSASLLSERWFMYAEDIDLSVYLNRYGRLLLATDLQAYHTIGGSAEGDQKARTVWVASLIDFHRHGMERSWLSNAFWRASFSAGFALRAAHQLARRDTRRARYMLSYARAAVVVSDDDRARINPSIAPISRDSSLSARDDARGGAN